MSMILYTEKNKKAAHFTICKMLGGRVYNNNISTMISRVVSRMDRMYVELTLVLEGDRRVRGLGLMEAKPKVLCKYHELIICYNKSWGKL